MLSALLPAAVSALAVLATAAPALLPVVQIPKQLVSPVVYYDILEHYATFIPPAANWMSQTCKYPPYGSIAVQYFDTTLTSTQALLYRDDGAGEFVLTFPGTDDLSNFLSDAEIVGVPYLAHAIRCEGCNVVLGFQDGWNTLFDILEAPLQKALADYPLYTMTIAGHSLGGAIAQLAYASLVSDGNYRITKAVTYGMPRVGNDKYAAFIDGLAGASEFVPGNFYRVTHANDPVPNYIPASLGYSQTMTEYWESQMDASVLSTYRCFGNQPSDCNLGTSGETLEDMPAHTSYAGLFYAGCNTPP